MSRRVCLIVAMALGIAPTLTAKGPTVRLTITGGGLASPITVTEARILSDSNVFHGTFLGRIEKPSSVDPAWPKFVISFFVESPSWMQEPIRKKYVVYYAKNPRTGQGFVYLPAPGEAWYDLNVSTILRNGLEGNWLHATSAWAEALNTYLP